MSETVIADLFKEHEGPVLASAAGLTAHFIFRRHEPTLHHFLGVVASVALAARFTAHDVLATTASFLATLSASILYYRLFSSSHPLYGLPGPLLARSSQVWIFCRVLQGQTRHDMRAVHAKYGDVVRIGPNEVSVSTVEAIREIHGSKSWIKGASYARSASGNGGAAETSLISLRNHALHTTRRKLWDRAFSMQSLKDYSLIIERRVVELAIELTARVEKQIDLHEWIGYFVWDIMTDLAYGGGGKMIKTANDTDGALESLCATLHHAGISKVLPWAAPLTAYLPGAGASKTFRETANRLFETRYSQGRRTAENDIFTHLLGEEREEKTPLTKKELAADSALVIAAGADTTRLVLSALFMFMLRTPSRYTDLQKTLDDVLGKMDRVPTHDDVSSIPLLDAYINEALRLCPPVPFANQREAPEGGATFGGHFVGEGSQVRVACYNIHRDPANFTKPDEFRPERWIKPDADEIMNKAAFFPFLAGAYHCVGKQFALQEMRLIVAMIVHRFHLKPAAGFDSYEFEKSFEDRGLIEIHDPLAVVLSKRSGFGEGVGRK